MASNQVCDVVSSKILCLLLLYFVQGIPYGFQARFLPIYLRSRGMSLTSLGFFKILLLPWMLKVFWAPLLERHASRRASLIWSLIAMATVCAIASCFSPEQTVALCTVVFLLNLAASTQDISVDAIAIQILSASELGAGNTVQVVGYKIGSIIGGGVLSWLIAYTEWRGLFILLSLLYVVTVLIVLQLDRLKQCNIDKGHSTPNGDSVLYQDNSEIPQHQTDSQTQSITNLLTDIVYAPHTVWMMIFAVIYKLGHIHGAILSGEQGAVGMFPLYLVDHGIPVSEVGFLTGVISQGLSIAGSLAGGWMLSNASQSPTPSYLLQCLLKLRILPIVVQAAVICCNDPESSVPLYGICITAMCLLQLIGGAVTICTFTLMMQCSQHAPRRIQATHYTALATLEVMGKLTFMSAAGWLVDWLGYPSMFCSFVGLSIGVLAMFKSGFKTKLL